MLDTVFAQPASPQGALDTVWKQVIDIVAQNQKNLVPERRQLAFSKLSEIRDRVSHAARRQSAVSLARHDLDPEIIAFFAQDQPAVAAPVLLAATLDAEGWQAVISQIPAPSRALLRERRDLPVEVHRMLSSFGSSDFALANEAQTDAAPGGNQIRDLVTKIETFRKEREAESLANPPSGPWFQLPGSESFRFETGADGLVQQVDGTNPGPIIGIDLSALAEAGEHGVDGIAAGAFRQRSPFQNARMVVPGAGPNAGTWLITGLPSFNSESGRFLGYRAVARRPGSVDQINMPNASAASGVQMDAVRQLVHELRTPLNAIRGFAEMIDGQLLGPVSSGYRSRATHIIDNSKRLLGLFDDLETVAKLETGGAEHTDPDRTDIVAIVRQSVNGVERHSNVQHFRLNLASDAPFRPAALPTIVADRMIGRLINTLAGLVGACEIIEIELEQTGKAISLKLDRPQCLIGKSQADLLDPAFRPDGQWPDAPALGLGFALRLVDSMARSVNAKFKIASAHFELLLPIGAQQNGDTSHA